VFGLNTAFRAEAARAGAADDLSPDGRLVGGDFRIQKDTAAAAAPSPEIREADLGRWRLLERFRTVLAEAAHPGLVAATWRDPARRLQHGEYLGLFLFGLLNPVVTTLRGLGAASRLPRVRREVCGRPVSLGSLSEAQALIAPELLAEVCARLAPAGPGAGPPGTVIDSTVMPALPRRVWAFWRRQNGRQNAVRLHVEFDLARGTVRQAEPTVAKVCEQAWWSAHARPGTVYIGDRNDGGSYGVLARLTAGQVRWLVRLQKDTRWTEAEPEPLGPAEKAAGVWWAGTVRLGLRGEGPRVRVVEVLGADELVVLATNVPAADLPAADAAALSLHRWQIERFFRWLKGILGCRHWLAESRNGVAVQVYLALIAAQPLVLHTGRRPGRREMELIQFFLLGVADEADLRAGLQRLAKKS
jgi:hypothetical protein